jgi:glutamine amidotransferase
VTRAAIIDCGISNVGSVHNALEFLGVENRIVHHPGELANYSHIVLPGDGSFPAGMKRLCESGLDQAVRDAAQAGKMILGVCLGMQLLAETGDEFEPTAGLGLIRGRVVAMRPDDPALRIPQIGWNKVSFRASSALTRGLGGSADFYFMQSFVYADPEAPMVTGTCDYGGPVAAVIEQGNIFGFQFHPEKSQRAGLRLLRNFCELG